MQLIWYSGAKMDVDSRHFWWRATHPRTIAICFMAYAAAVVVALQLSLPLPAAAISGLIGCFNAVVYLLYVVTLRIAVRRARNKGRQTVNASPIIFLFVAVFGTACLGLLHWLSGRSMNGTLLLGALVQWYFISEAAIVSYIFYVRPGLVQISEGAASGDPPMAPNGNTDRPDEISSRVLRVGSSAIRCQDVRLICAEGDYLRIYFNNVQSLFRVRFKDVLPQIPDALGLHAHRSYWVALTEVRALRRLPDRQIVIDTRQGRVLRVARARQDEVLARLMERGIRLAEDVESNSQDLTFSGTAFQMKA